MDGKRIILAAHRGDKKRFPENTLPAFEAAIKQRVDMIETDVHMTRDGALIIIHDRSLERTAGYEGFTNEVSLKEVKALDAGAWFGEELSAETRPTAISHPRHTSGSPINTKPFLLPCKNESKTVFVMKTVFP
jgi:glycerophosphoryl diester phosphodiesterase